MKRSLIFLAATLAASAAWAHAHLARSVPAADSVVPAPGEVRLWFDQRLEAALSRVEVRDAAGSRVDRGETRVDPKDGKVLSVALGAMPAGSYTVRWRAAAVDSHATEGTFTFTVHR